MYEVYDENQNPWFTKDRSETALIDIQQEL